MSLRSGEKPNWEEKDWKFSKLEKSLLHSIGHTWSLYSTHIIPEFTPISNQGLIGTCVANAWLDMMEILDGLIGTDKVEQLSRLFLYWCARYYTGDTDKDDGTYLRAAAHQLKYVGAIKEEYFPYKGTVDVVYKSPETDLYTMASNNRLTGFYKVTTVQPEQRLKELEIAIRSNHPVVFGAPVSEAFQNQRGMETFGPPGRDEIIGHHAMIIVGVIYDGATRLWLLRNSWGKEWGDDGHIKVTDDYVLDFQDVWVGTKMPELI
jgi:C1A family cysteine protease